MKNSEKELRKLFKEYRSIAPDQQNQPNSEMAPLLLLYFTLLLVLVALYQISDYT